MKSNVLLATLLQQHPAVVVAFVAVLGIAVLYLLRQIARGFAEKISARRSCRLREERARTSMADDVVYMTRR